ncbi:hypothetical protein AYO44_03935 [Planctomycetaceae bacterium SCGC AG-212-F19]|nr:hypothetical protein AYO44_03935 [Planctomycetaceae bacterium SCGC AG-212-F19]
MLLLVLLTSGKVASSLNHAPANDWPMWRHDAQHTGVSKLELAPQLHLQWVREYPLQHTAWLDQPHLIFDRIPEPVILDRTLFFGSARNDTLTALDTRSGAEKWVFQTNGPVRFAPAAWDGKVYFVSDDGHLYCLEAETGKLLWKFRGGPSDQHILGNGRLISLWPARGAPVIADGTVYFAASIWPFMGIFIHALDAQTGKVIWTNDGDGSLYMKQPHNADSFAGVAPQGVLGVAGDKVLIPGGRSVPACYDRATGKMIHYRLADNARFGGAEAAAHGNLVYNGGAIFHLPTGTFLGPFGKQQGFGTFKNADDAFKTGVNSIPAGKLPVLADDLIAGLSAGKLQAFDPSGCKVDVIEGKDLKGAKTQRFKFTMSPVDSFDAPKLECLIRSGSRLYVASLGKIEALELPLPKEKGAKPIISWQAAVAGTPASLLSADDRLFAVTLEGRILCFGAEKAATRIIKLPESPAAPADNWRAKARTILEKTKARDGYCLSWGVGSGRLVEELARQSNLHIVAVDPDEEKVRSARTRFIAAGLYGNRVAVLHGNPGTFGFPPYLASLVVSEDLRGAGVEVAAPFARKVFQTLRPYGGVACLDVPPKQRMPFLQVVAEPSLSGGAVKAASGLVLFSREGALPGAGNWTHEHADAANTRVSKDRIVKAPLGLLWFGGSSNEGILPRHGHGPQPQVVDGRLIIEGLDMLRCMDIYTGRVLWESKLPGVGKIYNNIAHQPGANATGSNFVSTPDSVYVVQGQTCSRVDIATGKKLTDFRLPKAAGAKQSPAWGYVNVYENYLVGTAEPLVVDPKADALPRQLQLWSVADRKVLLTLEGHTDLVTAVAFAPGAQTLATASGDKTVRLWDATTGKAQATLQGHTKRVTSLAFAPDGKTLASGSEDASVILWDLAARKQRGALKEHTDSVTGVAFAPDGKTLASSSADSTVKLWDPAGGKLLATLEGITDEVTCVAFAPDGKTLAAGSVDTTVKLWDVASREATATLEKHRDAVTSIAFATDGTTLASASRDKTVQLWDVAAGRPLATLEGQNSPVTCLAYAPDGQTLAAGTMTATVHLWDPTARKNTGALSGLPGAARSVAFGPGGKTLLMGGSEVLTKTMNESLSSSKQLVVMDRHSGKVLWAAQAQCGFRHNAICIGGGRLYCIDRYSGGEVARMKRRGQTPPGKHRVLALDLATGTELWSTDAEVFGTWLSYSERHDVLVEAGRPAGDTLWDEAKGMRAFRAGDGKVLWAEKNYVGPAMIRGDTILTGTGACELLTGKPKMREDPITGQPIPWSWTRNHGCNTPVASEHLMTFRSGAAGFCDLANDGGTGNFGGFRSSCSNNLIVAGGLLNAPDYTRSCTCGYQNQCSLAMVPMPDAELWTKFPLSAIKAPTNLLDPEKPPPASAPASGDKAPRPVKHLAINLGAPGHRRADDGRLWVNEYAHLKVQFDKFGFYNGHSSRIVDAGGSWPWVLASGCRGITQIELAIKPEGQGADGARFTVRLHFADPDNDQAGQRLFDVKVQGQTVLSQFDIVKEAGGRHRGVVKEFKKVKASDKLIIQFSPHGDESRLTFSSVPLLCGVEVLRDEE